MCVGVTSVKTSRVEIMVFPIGTGLHYDLG